MSTIKKFLNLFSAFYFKGRSSSPWMIIDDILSRAHSVARWATWTIGLFFSLSNLWPTCYSLDDFTLMQPLREAKWAFPKWIKFSVPMTVFDMSRQGFIYWISLYFFLSVCVLTSVLNSEPHLHILEVLGYRAFQNLEDVHVPKKKPAGATLPEPIDYRNFL